MRVKKLLVSLICIVALTYALLLPANALSAVVTMTTEYDELEVGDTFEVVVAVNSIKDDVGLVIFESRLYYDFDCFEIVSWEHNKPAGWGIDFEDFSTVWNVDGDKYFKCGYLYGGAGNVGVVDDNILFTTITFKVLSEEADGKTLQLKETEITNDNLESAMSNEASIIVNFKEEPIISHGGTDESSAIGDDSSIISTDKESSPAEDPSSADEESVAGDNKINMDNVLKIVFAVAVVVLIVAFGIFINQRRKSDKK